MPRVKTYLKLKPGSEKQKKVPPPCSALTHSNNPCKNRATILRGGRGLPVCWAHRKLGLVVTSCLAILEDNRRCSKKIPWIERQQLCHKHKDFALPCYILRLPTELLQHIFSYILDEYRSNYAKYYTYYSFLIRSRLNRHIFKATIDVLYRNFVCNIFLDDDNVFIFGRKCTPLQSGSWQRFRRFAIKFNMPWTNGPILENIRVIAALLRESYIMELHVSVTSHYMRHNLFRGVEITYGPLPLYMDAFLQLRRVREPRVTIIPDVSNEAELPRAYAFNRAKDMHMIMEWRRYYEEWVDTLKSGRLEG